MGFRKTIQSERSDGLNDFFLCFTNNAVCRHSAAQLDFDFFHACLRSYETKRAAEFFRFPTGKARGKHGHAKKLFLEKRDAERALESGFEKRVQRLGRLAALTAIQVGMNHFSDDRAGTDNRHLYDNVIKGC